MGVYYIGEMAGLPSETKPELEKFIQQGIPIFSQEGASSPGFVTLGTGQGGDIRLTVISLLTGSTLTELFMQCSRKSQKVQNLLENPTAEIAVTNGQGYVVLTCEAQVLDDKHIKKEKWEDWMAQYHPTGYASPDYVVLKFLPKSIRAMF